VWKAPAVARRERREEASQKDNPTASKFTPQWGSPYPHLVKEREKERKEKREGRRRRHN